MYPLLLLYIEDLHIIHVHSTYTVYITLYMYIYCIHCTVYINVQVHFIISISLS